MVKWEALASSNEDTVSLQGSVAFTSGPSVADVVDQKFSLVLNLDMTHLDCSSREFLTQAPSLPRRASNGYGGANSLLLVTS